jgi:hypothetical protein
MQLERLRQLINLASPSDPRPKKICVKEDDELDMLGDDMAGAMDRLCLNQWV